MVLIPGTTDGGAVLGRLVELVVHVKASLAWLHATAETGVKQASEIVVGVSRKGATLEKEHAWSFFMRT